MEVFIKVWHPDFSISRFQCRFHFHDLITILQIYFRKVRNTISSKYIIHLVLYCLLSLANKLSAYSGITFTSNHTFLNLRMQSHSTDYAASDKNDCQELPYTLYTGVDDSDENDVTDFKLHNSSDQIYREYDPPSNFHCAFSSWKQGRPTFCRSVCRCILYSFTLTVICGAAISIFPIFIVWLDINMGAICRQFDGKFYNAPEEIQKAQLTGDIAKAIFLQCWHLTVILPVFGWKLVEKLNLLPWTLLASTLDAIYRFFLYVYGLYGTAWSPFPRNVIFAFSALYSSYKIAKHYQQTIRERLRLACKLNAQFYLGFPLALTINYAVMHYFSAVSKKYKIVLAFLSPVLLILPKTVARLCAEKTEGLNHPGTSVLLIITLCAAPTIGFRLLQAKLEGFWIYFILSIVHGVESTFDKITLPLQRYILESCCIKGQQNNSKQRKPRVNRLLADLAIVSIIAESSAIFVSSIVIQYLRYYYGRDERGEKYHVTVLVREACWRTTTAILIEFLFNFIAIKVQTYYYNIPVIRVWKTKKFWIAAMFLLHTLMGILYFGYFYHALKSKDMFEETLTQNCTRPFHMP